MTARWLTAASVQIVGMAVAVVVAASVWSQPPPAAAIVAVLLVVVASVGLTSIVAGRFSLVALAACAIVVPLLATAWRGDGLRNTAAAVVWLTPGLLAVDASLRWHGKALTAGVGVAILSGLGVGAQLFFTDPFRVLDCVPFCRPNPFVIDHRPGISTVVRLLAAASLGWWVLVSARTERRHLTVILAVCAIGSLVLARSGWVRVLTARDTADRVVLAVVGVMLAVIVHDGIARDVRQTLLRRRIRAASIVLGTDAHRGGAQLLLGDAVRDPTLRVAYPLHDGRMVDADGTQVATDGAGDPATIRLVRRGELVAVVTGAGDRDLASAFTTHLIVAIENEGLLVRSRALLEELRRSRERLVTSADETRHRLERDLHDGAQQRLLAVTMLLAADHEASDEWRQAALDQATLTLAELRRIARGLYPVSLDRLGLEAALRSYLDEAPVAVELDVRSLTDRLSPQLERVVYRIVHTYADLAAHGGATILTVTIRQCDDEVSVGFEHDGRSTGDTTDIEDRVGAVGGSWSANERDRRQIAEAVIPCE